MSSKHRDNHFHVVFRPSNQTCCLAGQQDCVAWKTVQTFHYATQNYTQITSTSYVHLFPTEFHLFKTNDKHSDKNTKYSAC